LRDAARAEDTGESLEKIVDTSIELKVAAVLIAAKFQPLYEEKCGTKCPDFTIRDQDGPIIVEVTRIKPRKQERALEQIYDYVKLVMESVASHQQIYLDVKGRLPEQRDKRDTIRDAIVDLIKAEIDERETQGTFGKEQCYSLDSK